MRYTITLNDNLIQDLKDFFDVFLRAKMKEFIGLNLNDNRFVIIQHYIEDEYDSTITIETLKYAIDSMNRFDNGYLHLFEIDNNLLCNEVSNEKLITIIKLIEFGNLEVKGLGIFQETFNYIENNLSLLVEEYLYSK